MTTMATTQTPAQQYDRAIETIEWHVEKLNEVLGGGVTFGYIGNCDANGNRDDRSWMIFLPHPTRVGTEADRIGSFSTGDLAGAREMIAAAHGALRMARFIKGN